MNKENINDAINFIKNNTNVNKTDRQIKKYWSRHPFTPGHGYIHGLRVAKNAYTLSEKNNYENPELSFIAGLLHDISRPIEDKAGQEKHAKQNGEIAERILTKIHFNKTSIRKIKQAIENHEDLFKKNENSQKSPALLDTILYLADKMDMNMERCLIYGVISNFNNSKEKGKPLYKHTDRIINDFHAKLSNNKNTLLQIKSRSPGIEGLTECLQTHNTTIEDFARLLKTKKWDYQNYVEIAKQLTEQNVIENNRLLI